MELRGRDGWIEVICGSMFAGKTEELIRRITRIKFAKRDVLVFKPVIDDRYSYSEVVSHSQRKVKSIPVVDSKELQDHIDALVKLPYAVCIDEAQFFDDHIVEVCNQLANQGVRVIVAGLDLDFRGEPFGPMPRLLAIADEVSKVHAICVRCGALAYVSHRLVNVDKQVLLGEKMEYEPLCRDCYCKAIKEGSNKENA